MTQKKRKDFCTECRKETEYYLQKKSIAQTIREKEYTFEITAAVCAEWRRNESSRPDGPKCPGD